MQDFQGFARFFKVLEILDHGVFGKAKKSHNVLVAMSPASAVPIIVHAQVFAIVRVIYATLAERLTMKSRRGMARWKGYKKFFQILLRKHQNKVFGLLKEEKTVCHAKKIPLWYGLSQKCDLDRQILVNSNLDCIFFVKNAMFSKSCI